MTGARHTILVVEDDPECRDALVAVLEFDGHDVAAVADGAAGLLYLDTHDPPALILLDLMLPTMTGWRFLSEQKARPEVAAIPVVVVSGEHAPSKELAVAGYIRKPLGIDELSATVRRFVTPTKRAVSNPTLARRPSAPPNLAGLRVLIVDDDPLLIEAMMLLLDAAGAKTTTARSAADAWAGLEHAIPDVLISDVAMADEDGHSLIRRIRDHAPTRRLHAIALTGGASPDARERALDAGFDQYMTKPVSIEELRLRLANRTGR